MITDSESGTDAPAEAEERRRALYALKVMHDRGLLPRAEYERRALELGGEI